LNFLVYQRPIPSSVGYKEKGAKVADAPKGHWCAERALLSASGKADKNLISFNMDNLRKAFFASMVFSMILWSFGGALPTFAAIEDLEDGDLIKASGAAVYYYDADEGERWVFPNEKTYKTWFADFKNVKKISDAELADISIAGNIVYRGGTRLVKIDTDPKVYAVEPGGMLRWVTSEEIAIALWGADWAKRVDDVADAFFTNYDVDEDNPVEDEVHPTGSLVKESGSADVYYVDMDGTRRLIASGDAFSANMFMDKFVVTTDIAYEDGDDITGAEDEIVDASQSAASGEEEEEEEEGEEEEEEEAGALSVSLASDNPVSTSVLSDSNSTQSQGAQAFAPFLSLDFKAGSGDVKVTKLQFTRGGVSSDTDISNAYLFIGEDIMGEMSSFSNKVMTFSNSNGLFTVKKGETTKVWFKGDMVNAATAAKTVNFSLVGMDHVTTDGATVSGSFPLSGNLMTTARVDDLAVLDISSTTTVPPSIDPGPDVQELWRFTLQGSENTIQLEKVGMTMVGSIKESDLKDMYLEVDGVPVTDKMQLSGTALNFKFATPYKLTEGQTKLFILKGIVVNGSGRAFKFTIRDEWQFMAKDLEYNVYLKLDGTNTMALIDSDPSDSGIDGSDGTNVNSGTLTISRAKDSPVESVARGATNQVLAKFDLLAYGEDVKVDSLVVETLFAASNSDNNDGLRNGKLLFNGSQIGVTTNLDSENSADADQTDGGAALADDDDTLFSNFGNSFIIKAGTTGKLEIVADVLDASNVALNSGNSITVALESGSGNAVLQTSLGSYGTNAASGNTLTITAGDVSVSKNLAMPDGNSNTPTGVVGGKDITIGSFKVTASSAEGASVTSVTVADNMATNNTYSLADIFQNLKLMTSDGKQIGTTRGTLTDTVGTQYTFTPTPALELARSEQVVVNVVADVRSGLSQANLDEVNETDTSGEVNFYSLTATGKSTSNSVGTTTAVGLQDLYLSLSGSLAVALDASSPKAYQLVMGDTDQVLATYKLTAGTAEDVNVERLALAMNTWDPGAWTSLKLYDSKGNQLGSTVQSLNSVLEGNADDTGTGANILCIDGAGTGITLGTPSTTAEYYKGMVVVVRAGTGVGSSAVITTYDPLDTDGNCADTDHAVEVSGITFGASSDFIIGSQAVFNISGYSVKRGQSDTVTLKGSLNDYPSAISGIAHTPVLPNTESAPAATATTLRGKDSNASIVPTGWTVNANAQDVYRTKVNLASSTLGTSSAGANQTVMKFSVTADANHEPVLNTLAFTIGGTLSSASAGGTITGIQSTRLFDVNDQQNALATENYQTLAFAVDGDVTGEFENATPADCEGIPVGATVTIYDGSSYSTAVIESVDKDDDGDGTLNENNGCAIEVVGTIASVDANDTLTYYPLGAGSGKLYMGAQTTITTSNLADAATSVTVASTNGFSVGDTLLVAGYTSAGVAVTRSSGCVITGLTATVIYMTGCELSNDATIVFDYQGSASAPSAAALSTKAVGSAVVYVDLLNTSGEELGKGQTKTYVVIGDTTGLGANESLSLAISQAADVNWDDSLSFGITTDTRTVPVNGPNFLF
jgi:hypothetical protein